MIKIKQIIIISRFGKKQEIVLSQENSLDNLSLKKKTKEIAKDILKKIDNLIIKEFGNGKKNGDIFIYYLN